MESQNQNLIKYVPPSYSNFRLFSKRLDSFVRHHWPIGLTQTPRVLAEAGFFYTGKGDQVRCYQCGGGIHNWLAVDNPWIEHAKFYPACEYLLLVKSKNFIDNVQNNNKIGGKENTENDIKGKTLKKPNDDLSSDVENATTLLEHTTITSINNSNQRTKQLSYASSSEAKDEYLCNLCIDENRSIVFLPCGHCSVCKLCATSIKDCPVCRCEINHFVKVYFS